MTLTIRYYIPKEKLDSLHDLVSRDTNLTGMRDEFHKIIDSIKIVPRDDRSDDRRVNPIVLLDDDLEWSYSADIPLEYVRAFTEVLTGDLRAMRDPVTGERRLYRRSFSVFDRRGINRDEVPRGWHSVDSVDDEYMPDLRRIRHLIHLESFLMSSSELLRKSLLPGIVFRYRDRSVHYYLHEKRYVSDDCESLMNIRVNTTEYDALEKSKMVLSFYQSWCSDGIDNLLLAMASPWIHPKPEVMFVMYGDGASGKSRWSERLRDLSGGDQIGCFSFDFKELLRDNSATRGILHNAISMPVGYIDDFSDFRLGRSLFEEAWGQMKSIVTGSLPRSARLLYKNTVSAPVRAHLFMSSNYDIGIKDPRDGDNSNTRRIAACVVSRSNEMADALDTGSIQSWMELLLSCESWSSGMIHWRNDVFFKEEDVNNESVPGIIVNHLNENKEYHYRSGGIELPNGERLVSWRQVGKRGILRELGIRTVKTNGDPYWTPDLTTDGGSAWRRSVERYCNH